MKHTARNWFSALALLLLVFSLPAQAQLVAGRDYLAIDPPLSTDAPGKIEVIEFFSYACPHCADLHPHLAKWAGRQPADVVVRRVPVVFSPFYQLMAKLYYSLEVTGDLARLDSAVFSAIHEKGLKLVDEKSILDWVTAQGVDGAKFKEAWSSFGVNSKSSRGNQLAQAARVSGVPALVVDGRYLVVGKEVKNLPDILPLTDKVIDMRRGERGSKKK